MLILIIVLILLSIALIVGLCVFINRRFISTKKVKRLFEELSLGVVGERGSGKDTLFSYISYKIPHNCNIPLQNHTNIISLNELMIPNLQRSLLVEGYHFDIDFDKYKHFINMTFVSDAGIHFPNYEDSKLKKEYSSLAITIAIWRHLFDSSLHFNLQYGGRLWIILREQLSHIIETKGTKWGLFYCKLYLTFYEKIEDYEKGKGEIKKPLLMKDDSNLVIESSNRGEVKDYVLLIPKRMINHDTHYFKKIVFKEGSYEEE